MIRPVICAVALLGALVGKAEVSTEAPPRQSLSSESPIFAESLLWQTDLGQSVSFKQWLGRPFAVAMIYADCHMSCPPTIETIRFLDKKLGKNCQFVLVTLDPRSDSVELLHQLRENEHLGAHIIILRGTDISTQQLASFLGIAYRRDALTLAHQSVIVLVDRQGDRSGRFPGSPPDLDGFRRALSSMH